MNQVPPLSNPNLPQNDNDPHRKQRTDQKTQVVSANIFQQICHGGYVALKGLGHLLYSLFDYFFHSKKLPMLVNPPHQKDPFLEAQKNGATPLNDANLTKSEACRQLNNGMFFNPEGATPAIKKKAALTFTPTGVNNSVVGTTVSKQDNIEKELTFCTNFWVPPKKAKVWGICDGHGDYGITKQEKFSAHHFVADRLPKLVQEKLKNKSLNEQNFSSFMQGVMQQLSLEMKEAFADAPSDSSSLATLAGVIEVGDHVFLFSLGDTSICKVSRQTGSVDYLLTPTDTSQLPKKFQPLKAPCSAIGAYKDQEGKTHQEPLLLSVKHIPKDQLTDYDLVVHSRGFDVAATDPLFYSEMGSWMKEHANDHLLNRAKALANGAINNGAPSCTVMVGKY